MTADVRRGVRLFNQGRWVAAHQHWEALWQHAPLEDRPLLEGLIQLATGLHLRTRRGATRGAEHLLSLALIALEDYQPARHGIDVSRLIADTSAYLDWMRAARRPHRFLDRRRLPRIRKPSAG